MEDIIELRGPNLRLSNNLEKRFAKGMAKAANHPEIARNIGSHSFPHPYTEEDALIWFDHNRKEGRKFFAIDFLIFYEEQVVGVIGLKDINYTDLNAHIGYWIGKEYWNRGFATEALSILSQYCKAELGLVRLYSGVLDYNLASLRVMMKNGYRVEGFQQDCFKMEDGFHSMFLVAKIL